MVRKKIKKIKRTIKATVPQLELHVFFFNHFVLFLPLLFKIAVWNKQIVAHRNVLQFTVLHIITYPVFTSKNNLDISFRLQESKIKLKIRLLSLDIHLCWWNIRRRRYHPRCNQWFFINMVYWLIDWFIYFWCLTPLSAKFQLYYGDQF